MKCFNHQDSYALGICKNCNKGICDECLSDVGNGIACTATCVDEVNQVNSLVNQNKKAFGNASSTHYRSAIILAVMGGTFLFFGLQSARTYGFLVVMGILMLVWSIFSVINARKYKRD